MKFRFLIMKSDAKNAFQAGWADAIRIDIHQMRRVFYNYANGRYSFNANSFLLTS